ncbi:MAG: hypothetical protein WA748_16555 [Candidatus Acidiferrum sp.]
MKLVLSVMLLGHRGQERVKKLALGDGVSRFCDLASRRRDSPAAFVLLFYGSIMVHVSH